MCGQASSISQYPVGVATNKLRERHSWYRVERRARVSPDAEPLKVNLKVEPIPSPQGVMNRRPPPDLGGNYGHFSF